MIEYFYLGALEVQGELNYNEGVLPKAPELEPHHKTRFRVIPRTLVGWGVLPSCRDTICVFYRPIRFIIQRRFL